MLSFITQSLHELLHTNTHHVIRPSMLSHSSRPATPEDKASHFMGKQDMINRITNSLMDELIERTVHYGEEKEEVVASVVNTVIDIIMDSKQREMEEEEKRGRKGNASKLYEKSDDQLGGLCFEDELFVKETTDELVDGLVEMMGENDKAPIFVNSSDSTELRERIIQCELVLVAMNRILQVWDCSNTLIFNTLFRFSIFYFLIMK